MIESLSWHPRGERDDGTRKVLVNGTELHVLRSDNAENKAKTTLPC